MTPAETSTRRPANRRALLLDAASRLFARRGFHGVSVADIGEAVGVTAPALYRHFANKDAILVSIVLDTADRLDALIDKHRDAESPLAGCVRALTTAVLDRPDQVVTYLRERHRLEGADAVEQTQRERHFTEVFGRMVAAACAGLHPDAAAVRTIGAVGVLRGFAERSPAMPRPAADAFIAEAILTMLTSEPVSTATPRQRDRGGWAPLPSRREEILRVALGLFRTRGFGGVGMGEIGDHAGVGASNVHRYFDAKEDILVDLYDRVGSQVHVRIDDAIAGAVDAPDALDRMIRAYCQVAFDAADLVVVVTQSRGALPAGERPRLRRRDRRIMDLWRAVVAEVRHDLRPNEVATIVAGILPMVNMYPQIQAADLPDIDHVAPLVRAFVLGGRR